MTKSSIWLNVFKLSKGRFFGVSFYKRDRKFRRLNGKVGKYPVVVRKDQFVPVLDVKNGGFRSVNVNTIKSFKCGELKFSE